MHTVRLHLSKVLGNANESIEKKVDQWLPGRWRGA